tara:strand:- start:111 stop:344 length:234 start_codon:yes stop_codon:yes gene_type:complete
MYLLGPEMNSPEFITHLNKVRKTLVEERNSLKKNTKRYKDLSSKIRAIDNARVGRKFQKASGGAVMKSRGGTFKGIF